MRFLSTTTLLTLLGLCAAGSLRAQTFSAPESVAYDALRHRWLVSENGANRIDIYRPQTGALTPFSTMISSGPHGLEILGDTLYACDGGRLRGFALGTGALTLNLNLGATFLNGLTTDGARYLFATDFTGKKIYRVNPRAGTFNVLASPTRTPNGIAYDGANNRLLFVTWGSGAAVQAVSLADSTISIVRTTTLTNLDGITRDPAGNWYVTAWGTNALHRFDPAFSTVPVLVRGGLSSPADIEANAAGDSIAIPNAGNANNVVFFTGTLTGLAPTAPLQPMRCWPNPATTHCLVQTEPPGPGATLILLDGAGRPVRRHPLLSARTIIARGELPAGCYRVLLYDGRQRLRAAQKLVIE